MDLVLQGLVKLTAPDSLSFLEESRRLFTVQEFKDSESLKKLILPGDIVITKTPSTVHKLFRRLTKSEFDHIAVFVNPDNVIHVAPPKIRLINSNIFLMKRYNPVIVRPNIPPEEIKQFLEKLMNSEHESYDYNRTMRIVGLKVLENFINLSKYPNLKQQNTNKLSESKMCSDLIFFTLAMSSEKMLNSLRSNMKILDFYKYGNFTPDDLILLVDADKESFNVILLNQNQIDSVKASKKQLQQEYKQQQQKQIQNQELIQQQQQQSQNTIKLQQQQQQIKQQQQKENQKSHSKIQNKFKQTVESLQNETKIILENSQQENEDFFVKSKSLVDKVLFFANFNKFFSISFLNRLISFKANQKKQKWITNTLFGSNTDSADLVLLTFRIMYHAYHLKIILSHYSTFQKNKSKFILHFASLLLLLNSVTNPQSAENSMVSRIALPKL